MNPYPNLTAVTLERVRTQFRRYLSPHIAADAEVEISDYAPAVGDMIAMDVMTDIMTEKLPPTRVERRVRYEHPEALGRPGVAADARFANWTDHFVATYRGRWWGRLLRLHKRKLNYTFVKVPYIVSAPVSCDHLVSVDIANSWTYPKATTTLRGFGEPVLRADRHTTGATALYGTAERWH